MHIIKSQFFCGEWLKILGEFVVCVFVCGLFENSDYETLEYASGKFKEKDYKLIVNHAHFELTVPYKTFEGKIEKLTSTCNSAIKKVRYTLDSELSRQ